MFGGNALDDLHVRTHQHKCSLASLHRSSSSVRLLCVVLNATLFCSLFSGPWGCSNNTLKSTALNQTSLKPERGPSTPAYRYAITNRVGGQGKNYSLYKGETKLPNWLDDRKMVLEATVEKTRFLSSSETRKTINI